MQVITILSPLLQAVLAVTLIYWESQPKSYLRYSNIKTLPIIKTLFHPELITVSGVLPGLKEKNNLLFCCLQARGDRQSKNKDVKISPYHIWRIAPPAKNGFRLIFISLAPKLINQEDMLRIATSLNKRFQKYDKIKVILFDNPVLAKNYALGHIEPMGLETEARGLYYLSRKTTEEYIQFSTQLGNSYNEVKISLPK